MNKLYTLEIVGPMKRKKEIEFNSSSDLLSDFSLASLSRKTASINHLSVTGACF